MEHFDVMIVGASLSGVGAACHLKQRHPRKSLVILEGRAAMGGTWDLFRYPGVRSDSDMYTLGYRFRPWRDAKAIADGPAILNYIRETAAEFGVDKKIRYGHRVRRACWLSADARWTVEQQKPEKRSRRQKTGSLATSSISARATTITRVDTRRTGLTSRNLVARLCTRRSGPPTSTTKASALS